MINTWFTSDLHFSHKRIVEFTNRGVDTTVEHHDEWLIDLWNSQVQKGDVVYHLGDFSFAKNVEDTLAFIRKLNGVKHFLKGNHDYSDNFKRYREAGVTTHEYLERKFDGQNVVMFHFAIASWHRQGYGSWHLHGHSHGNFGDSKGKMLDVGLDSAYNVLGKHEFFHLDTIKDIMDRKEVYVADVHRNKAEL